MPIDSRVYDRNYFGSDLCEGWNRFQVDRGLSPIKARELELLAPRPGISVLDAGCGRGEVLLACSRKGAEIAGIDYSEAAIELTRETLDGIGRADVRLGDVTALPWDGESFDAALLGDVIEHLDHDQVPTALTELRRVLRPGGVLVVHTAPNRRFLQIGWPLARFALRLAGRRDSVDRASRWIAQGTRYHVSEQSRAGLHRALRAAGFVDARAWVDPDVIRSQTHHLTYDLVAGSRLLTAAAALAGRPPLHNVFGNDIFAVARR